MALGSCGLNISSSLKELQPHGTAQFPCAGYESFHDIKKEDDLPWHRHEEIEIIHIISGTMRLLVPGREFIVHEGEIVFINSDIAHFSEAVTPYTLNSYVFSSLLVTGNSTSVFSSRYLMPVITCTELSACMITNDNAVSVFHQAFECLRNDAFAYEFTVREALSKLTLYVYQENLSLLQIPENEEDIDAKRLETMISFIRSHYQEEITLSDIASSASISERECLRCFKRSVKDSPVQYLMKFRLMSSASILLSMPSLSITEVAEKCGFRSSSYFTELFKRHYKMTPKQFRKENSYD